MDKENRIFFSVVCASATTTIAVQLSRKPASNSPYWRVFGETREQPTLLCGSLEGYVRKTTTAQLFRMLTGKSICASVLPNAVEQFSFVSAFFRSLLNHPIARLLLEKLISKSDCCSDSQNIREKADLVDSFFKNYRQITFAVRLWRKAERNDDRWLAA